MNLGELKNDGVIIQLANRSNAYPKGVVEDVLVQVNNLIFPADFYVLDMEDGVYSTPLPIQSVPHHTFLPAQKVHIPLLNSPKGQLRMSTFLARL